MGFRILMKSIQFAVAFGAMVYTGNLSAELVVIDFEVLKHDEGGVILYGDSYTEDGFALNGIGFRAYATNDPRFSGSTALWSGSPQGTITLTKVDGGEFALKSINIAELFGAGTVNVPFVGQISGGGTTSQNFATDGIFSGQETFYFDSTFSSVTSVSWIQNVGFHQFDNIVAEPVTAVPEPSSLALLAIAGAGFFIRIGRGRFLL